MSNGTIYKLGFRSEAKKEWDRLTPALREQFGKKLLERRTEPHVPSARLRGSQHRYKIKLAKAGYRLIYEVQDEQVLIVVVAVGRRDRNAVYKAADKR